MAKPWQGWNLHPLNFMTLTTQCKPPSQELEREKEMIQHNIDTIIKHDGIPCEMTKSLTCNYTRYHVIQPIIRALHGLYFFMERVRGNA